MASLFRKSRLPRSLVGRSLLASVGALLLVMLLLGAAVAMVLAGQSEPFSWEGPGNQEAHIEEAMRFDAQVRLLSIEPTVRAREAFDALSKDMAYQVLDASGQELFTSPQGSALQMLRHLPLDTSQRTVRSTEGGLAFLVLTSAFERGGTRYLVRIARSDRLALGIRANGSAIFYLAAVLTGLLAVLVFCTIAWWTARQAIKPLREASEAAAAIQPGNLTQRVDSRDLPSEITPLVEAFNSALGRLEEGYRVQQEFLAAAAHELKTPLALMRAEIELGDVENKSLLLGDIDAMAVQVQQLLNLAEVSEIQNFKFQQADIAEIVEETVAQSARFAETKSVHLRLIVEDSLQPCEADAGAVSTLLRNLIENAVHHSPTGGVVTIRLSSSAIAVLDQGPGVAPDEVSRLFTRFWRSESAPHAGAGLGLSICQKIAAAHGWRVVYRHAAAEPGAEFRVEFRP